MSEQIARTEIVDVLAQWDVGKPLKVTDDALGTINRTWLVTTDRGRYALRLSGNEDTAALQRECDLVSRVAALGIPAVEPLQTTDGQAYVDVDGRLWTLSPFAPGSQTDRSEMSLEQDRGMGRCLGQLLEVLKSCPPDLVKRKQLGVDVGHTLAEIERYEQLIARYSEASEAEQYALDRLAGRRVWIEAHADEKTDGLTRLAVQPIHGDFQEKNVFFDDRGDVVAIIDWDNARLAPREWEIIRTLNFVMNFDPVRCVVFAEGYREHAALDLPKLDRAAWAYGVKRTHDLFLFQEIYDRGNDRARRFLNPGPFVPVYDRWVPARDALSAL